MRLFCGKLVNWYLSVLLFAEEKDGFEQRWHSPRAGDPMHVLPRNDDSLHNPSDTSIFRRLFSGLLYPGTRKD